MVSTAMPTQAQNIRSWVSSDGNDSNACSRSAPCATFGGALLKTSIEGEINCVDAGSFGGTLAVTKSVTINCHEISASILNPSTGISVLFDSFADPIKTVRLRNINVSGVGVGSIGIQITGGASVSGGTVIIEDCVIEGHSTGNGRGIDDQRSGGGKLIIANTIIRNNRGAAISVLPNGGSSNIQVLLDSVRAYNNGTGGQFGNLTRVMIDQSVFAANTGAGILTVSGAIVEVDRSTISHNSNGVQANGGLITLSNSNIKLNTSQGVNISGGIVNSFGNNRINNNASPGIAPTAAGAVSTDLGQQ
jgi:hypothetical protein